MAQTSEDAIFHILMDELFPQSMQALILSEKEYIEAAIAIKNAAAELKKICEQGKAEISAASEKVQVEAMRIANDCKRKEDELSIKADNFRKLLQSFMRLEQDAEDDPALETKRSEEARRLLALCFSELPGEINPKEMLDDPFQYFNLRLQQERQEVQDEPPSLQQIYVVQQQVEHRIDAAKAIVQTASDNQVKKFEAFETSLSKAREIDGKLVDEFSLAAQAFMMRQTEYTKALEDRKNALDAYQQGWQQAIVQVKMAAKADMDDSKKNQAEIGISESDTKKLYDMILALDEKVLPTKEQIDAIFLLLSDDTLRVGEHLEHCLSDSKKQVSSLDQVLKQTEDDVAIKKAAMQNGESKHKNALLAYNNLKAQMEKSLRNVKETGTVASTKLESVPPIIYHYQGLSDDSRRTESSAKKETDGAMTNGVRR